MHNKREILNKILEKSINDIEIVKLSNTMYKVGYCCQCGGCCKTISIDTLISPISKEFLEAWGVSVTTKTAMFASPEGVEPDKYSATLTIPCKCQNLLVENSLHYCAIYENRPAICQSYPKNQSRWSTCTYVFLNIEEFKWFSDKLNTKKGE